MASSQTIRVGLIGDYDPAVIAHQAIQKALQRAQEEIGQPLEFVWISTDSIENAGQQLANFHGLRLHFANAR